jgi:hypothetical protein
VLVSQCRAAQVVGANPATSVGLRSGATLAERRRFAEQLGRNVVVQTRGSFAVGLEPLSMEQRGALARRAQFGISVPSRGGSLSLAARSRRDLERLILLRAYGSRVQG